MENIVATKQKLDELVKEGWAVSKTTLANDLVLLECNNERKLYVPSDDRVVANYTNGHTIKSDKLLESINEYFKRFYNE